MLNVYPFISNNTIAMPKHFHIKDPTKYTHSITDPEDFLAWTNFWEHALSSATLPRPMHCGSTCVSYLLFCHSHSRPLGEKCTVSAV